MNSLGDMLWIELLKSTRSRMPLLTVVGSMLLPMAGGFLVFVYKYPDFARSTGLISAKAHLVAFTPDWPSFMGILIQGISIGGIILFSLMASWVFGREFVDGTCKDLLAVPIPRSMILLAKFIVVAIWSGALTAMTWLVALGLGALIGLPEASLGLFIESAATLAFVAGMVIATITPVALFASVGRGYLLPMGLILLLVGLGNVVSFAGYGSYFPWMVPALYAGASGAQNSILEPASYLLVILTGLAGLAGTYIWWMSADQNR